MWRATSVSTWLPSASSGLKRDYCQGGQQTHHPSPAPLPPHLFPSAGLNEVKKRLDLNFLWTTGEVTEERSHPAPVAAYSHIFHIALLESDSPPIYFLMTG